MKAVFREEGDAIVVDWTERSGRHGTASEGGGKESAPSCRASRLKPAWPRDHPWLEAHNACNP